MTIFSLDDQEAYIEERHEGLKQGYKNNLELTPEVQSYLIEKIKEYLSKDAEGNFKHEVWIVTSEIKAGKDWREEIFKRHNTSV